MVLKKLATTIKSSLEYELGWSRDQILNQKIRSRIKEYWGISDTINSSDFHHLLQNHRAKILCTKSLLWWRRSIFITSYGRVILQWVSKTNSWKYTEHIKKIIIFFSFQTDNHRITEVFFLFFLFLTWAMWPTEPLFIYW